MKKLAEGSLGSLRGNVPIVYSINFLRLRTLAEGSYVVSACSIPGLARQTRPARPDQYCRGRLQARLAICFLTFQVRPPRFHRGKRRKRSTRASLTAAGSFFSSKTQKM